MSKEAMKLALDHLMNLQPILGNGLLEERQLAFIDPHIDCAIAALQEGMLAVTSRDSLDQLERFAALVRADERNECAKVCEELVPDMSRTANDASIWDVATTSRRKP